jgi:hypothetical protein
MLACEDRSHYDDRNENGSRNDQVLKNRTPLSLDIFSFLHPSTNYPPRAWNCNTRARQIPAIPFAAAPLTLPFQPLDRSNPPSV